MYPPTLGHNMLHKSYYFYKEHKQMPNMWQMIQKGKGRECRLMYFKESGILLTDMQYPAEHNGKHLSSSEGSER